MQREMAQSPESWHQEVGLVWLGREDSIHVAFSDGE